jgi:hypothetical protein
MRKPTHSGSTSGEPGEKRSFPVLELRERDRRILKLVYEHRFLDTELLLRLLKVESGEGVEYAAGSDGKRRPTRYGFGEKALYKRLQLLTSLEYLQRRRLTEQLAGRGQGAARGVYGLGPKSIGEVSTLAGVAPEEIRRIVESNSVKGPFLQHALEVAKFRVILELACQESAGGVRLLFWEQGQVLQDWVKGEDEDGEEREFSVFPDAFFALEVQGKGRAHYFLEADRGTMPIVATRDRSDIRKKVLGYGLYRRYRRHSQRYQYRTLPDGTIVGLHVADRQRTPDSLRENTLEPIKSFTVLFVAPGATGGTLSLRGRVANILSALPTFGRHFSTSTLFWFASLDSFELDRPETIFAPVWLTPNPEKQYQSLIE